MARGALMARLYRQAPIALLSAKPSNCVMPAIHDHTDNAEEEHLVVKHDAPFSPPFSKQSFVKTMTLVLEKHPNLPITEEMLGPMYDIMCSKEAHKLINACADCCGADSQISQVVCAQMAVKAKERGYFFGYLVPMAALVVIGATELGHVYGHVYSFGSAARRHDALWTRRRCHTGGRAAHCHAGLLGDAWER